MPDYKFVVFSNPTEGRESDYNRWYDDVHLGEVTAIPGFTGATRYRVVPGPDAEPRHRYMAIYDISSDDIGGTLAELTTRAETGKLEMSDALGEVQTILFEAMPAPAAAR